MHKTPDGKELFRRTERPDDHPEHAIGALAVAPSDSQIVWAGTGEPHIRSNVSIGSGVYKSTDGGETWNPVQKLHDRVGYSWYRWEHNWTPPAEGKYTLMCRATNVLGVTQPMEFPNPWDGRGYGNNMVFPFEVEVRG